MVKKSHQIQPRVTLSPSSHYDTRFKVNLAARLLLKAVTEKLCTCTHRVFTGTMCSFSKTTLHGSHMHLFVKHLAMCSPTGKCQTKHQHRGRQQHFVNRMCLSATSARRATKLSGTASAAKTGHGCNTLVLTLVQLLCE